MTTTASILMFGRDPGLLDTRRWVLESAGYHVCAVTEFDVFDRVTSDDRTELLIACHTLSPEERARALALAHARCPRAKSLVLKSSSTQLPADLVEEVLDTGDGPAKLVSTVGNLTHVAQLITH